MEVKTSERTAYLTIIFFILASIVYSIWYVPQIKYYLLVTTAIFLLSLLFIPSISRNIPSTSKEDEKRFEKQRRLGLICLSIFVFACILVIKFIIRSPIVILIYYVGIIVAACHDIYCSLSPFVNAVIRDNKAYRDKALELSNSFSSENNGYGLSCIFTKTKNGKHNDFKNIISYFNGIINCYCSFPKSFQINYIENFRNVIKSSLTVSDSLRSMHNKKYKNFISAEFLEFLNTVRFEECYIRKEVFDKYKSITENVIKTIRNNQFKIIDRDKIILISILYFAFMDRVDMTYKTEDSIILNSSYFGNKNCDLNSLIKDLENIKK
jgi:hypothetical protein